MDFSACKACVLSEKVNHVGLPSVGNPESKLFIIMDRPGYKEDNLGVSFSGQAGQFLSNLLVKSGLVSDESYYLTYLTKCALPDTKDLESKRLSVKACVPEWLEKEIQQYKPAVIIALGNDVMAALSGKNGIVKNRGLIFDIEVAGHPCKMVPIFSPSYLLQDRREFEENVVYDIRRAVAMLDGNVPCWTSDSINHLTYKIIETEETFREFLKEVGQSEAIACDIECRGKDAYRTFEDRPFPLVSIQFSTKEKTAWFLPVAHEKYLREDNPTGLAWDITPGSFFHNSLTEIFSGKYFIVGHNFKFDSKFILKFLGIRVNLNFDTMLAHGLFEETSNSLKKIAWEATNMGGYEKSQQDYTDSLPSEKQYDMFFYPFEQLALYGNADADVTYRIFKILDARLRKDAEKLTVFKLLINASMAFLDIENDGIKLDTPYLSKLGIELDIEANTLEEEFKKLSYKQIMEIEEELTVEATGKSGKILKNKPTLFNISSNDHIYRLFFDKLGIPPDDKYKSKKTGEYSIGRPFLNSVKDDYPIADKLLKYRTVSKQKSGFVEAYPQFIDSEGRIHPDYRLIKFFNEDSNSETGTLTGRLSCCLAEGTLVTCVNGQKPIEDIKVGDLVYTFDENEKLTIKPVLQTFDNGKKECIKLTWENASGEREGELVCTPDHRIWSVKRNMWIEAKDLVKNEKVGFVYRRPIKTGRNETRIALSYNGCGRILEEQLIKTEFYTEDAHFISHHINGNTLDNRVENIQIMTSSEHVRYHGQLRVGELSPSYIEIGKFSLLKQLAKAKGRPTYVDMDFNTLKKKCVEKNINLKNIIKRYGCRGVYINKASIIKALIKGKNNESACKILGIGTRALVSFMNTYGIEYNHRIISIIKAEFYNTYDLEIKDTHNFIANELKVHNSNPNLQQVPSRGEGKRIKKLFIPDFEEHWIGDCDFAGIELRVAAMHSQDKAMKKFFNEGKGDFHRWVASQIYSKTEENVTDSERTYAKSTTFGILYGAGPAKIAEQANMSERQAIKFIDQYFKLFPELKKWIQQQKSFAERNLYVKSLFGRIRSLPNAGSRNEGQREAAFRRAVNSVIQSDASDLTLHALTRIHKYLRKFNHADIAKPSRLRGSVHDSILLTIHDKNLEEILKHIKFNILEAPTLSFILDKGVKLRADVAIGKNWGAKESVEFEE